MNLFDQPVISAPRVFGVGFNKTGTTSLGACFEILGLGPVAGPQTLHDTFGDVYKSPVGQDANLIQNRQELFETYSYISICKEVFDYSNYGLALHIASGFKSFHDRPWNVKDFYKILDWAFPDSLFILTTRDPESWWQCVDRWLNNTHIDDDWKRSRYLKHLEVGTLDRESCISAYLAHNEGIRHYFLESSRQKRFLELRLESDFNWQVLCSFLKLPIPNQPFPHQNQQHY